MRTTSWHRGISLLLIAGLAGCARLPIPMQARTPAPLSEKLARYYDYTPVRFKASVESVEKQDGYTIQRMVLTLRQAQGEWFKETFRPIKIDWYAPEKPEKRPTILISPILAGNDLYIREFARFFTPKGFNAVIVYRSKEVFTAERSLSDIEKHLRESIIQLRQVIDWLETQESVDPDRIGSFAISMGAILTSVLAAVEPRVKASVLALPAGHIPEILMASQDKAIRKRRNNYMRENQIKPEELYQQLKEVIVTEPMTFAPAIDPNRILIVTGLFDRVLGLGRALTLWRKMGRPPLILLPTGHYTAVLATPALKVMTYSFLRRKLR